MTKTDWKTIFVTALVVSFALAFAYNYYIPETHARTLDDSKATDEGIEKVTEGNNKFAFDLYKKLASEEDGNVFFSPWSISTALSMTYEGARGKTEKEMEEVLHLPENDVVRRSSFARLYNLMNLDKEYELKLANALWAHKDYDFLESYMDINKHFYGAKIENLDFVNERDKARETINSWVEEKTENKIEKLIEEGMLNHRTRLVLTNAIYFKGTWLKQFDPQDTDKGDFKVSPGNKVEVPMMELTGDEAEFDYTETEDLQALKLPYKGKDLSMLLLLPKEDFGLSQLEGNLTAGKIEEIESGMEEQRVDVYMPKFEFETEYSLKKQLMDLGMKNPFSMEANFSGMDGTYHLLIQFVEHKAYVKVNEEGTEAAAATGVGVDWKAALKMEMFRADHPFMFMIKDERTGGILFMGKVKNPLK